MKRTFSQRFFEILPGALTWVTFIAPFFLTFSAPVLLSVIILIYALYWLFKTILMSLHLISGFLHYRQAMQTDWQSRLRHNVNQASWHKLYHLVIIATYKEELPILRASFNALVKSSYPKDKLIVVLGVEERDKERGLANSKALEKEFGSQFFHFTTTIHPKNITGEVPGKGGNITYAARQIKKFIDSRRIPYENIITTTLDADHRVDTQYFACLSYVFLNTPDPIHKSFQPIPLFFNNIWQTPFPMRMIAMGSSFWQMIEATRPQRLRNFASHAQSFAGLIETDFWSTSTIVEDGHQYWRSYFSFHGNYAVVPIFIPIYQDAVLAGTFWETVKEQYLQKRRWAWGASDIPYAFLASFKEKKIGLWEKIVQLFRLIEGNYTWATTSIVLAVVGWLPIYLNADFSSSVLAFNFPYYYRLILTSAMFGMVVTLTISTILLPPPPGRDHISRPRLLLEWVLTPILLPVANIMFSSLPAIESQTRLMLGKYLGEFRVTVKKPVLDDTPSS